MRTELYAEAGRTVPRIVVTKLEQLETETGLDIVLRWGGGHYKEPPNNKKQLILYDYASSDPQATRGRHTNYRLGTPYYRDYGGIVSDQAHAAGYGGPPGIRLNYAPLEVRLTYMRQDRQRMQALQLFSTWIYNAEYDIAEVGNMVVWFLYDLRNWSSTDPEFMDAYFEYLIKPPIMMSLNKEALKEAADRKKNEAKYAFLDLFKGLVETKKIEANRKKQNAENNLAVYQDQLRGAFRQIREAEIEVRAAEEMMKQDNEDMKLEAKRIMESDSFVGQFELKDGINGKRVLAVKTRPIYLYKPNRRERAYLGQFEFQIGLDNYAFMFVNLDNKKKGADHPHGGGYGQVCMGSKAGYLEQMIANGDIHSALEQAILAMETYNPSDGGARPSLWFTPEATERLAWDGKFYKRGEAPKKPREKSSNGKTTKGDRSKDTTATTKEVEELAQAIG